MGAVSLDLREAQFSGHEVTIQTFALMGGIDIIVDEEIAVDVSGFAFMGGFDHRAAGPGLPGAPRLKVVGFAMMGGVNVQRRPPRKKKPRELRDRGAAEPAAGRAGPRPVGAGRRRRRPPRCDLVARLSRHERGSAGKKIVNVIRSR